MRWFSLQDLSANVIRDGSFWDEALRNLYDISTP